MGVSPTFAGEGLVMCLVKNKLSDDVRKSFAAPLTDIYTDGKTHACEWVDEYLRNNLSDEYTISTTLGAGSDNVVIYKANSTEIEWNFRLFKTKRDFKYSEASIIGGISYKEGEIKLTETLLSILQRKTPLLRNKQPEDFYYLYEPVFLFTTDKSVGLDRNVRQYPSIPQKPATSSKKNSNPNTLGLFHWETDYQNPFQTNAPSAPPPPQPQITGFTLDDPNYAYVTYPTSEEEPDVEQDNGTW